MTKQESEDLIQKLFEPTIENAIRDMKISKLFFLIKDNKFYSSIANEYMRDKEKFLPFIIEDKQKEFISKYTQVFQGVGIVDDSDIAWTLQSWEHSGNVMMLLNANTDWNAVDDLLHLQGHSGGTMNCLASKVLYFSPYGLDFIEHIWGVKERKKVEKEMNSLKASTIKRKKSRRM